MQSFAFLCVFLININRVGYRSKISIRCRPEKTISDTCTPILIGSNRVAKISDAETVRDVRGGNTEMQAMELPRRNICFF